MGVNSRWVKIPSLFLKCTCLAVLACSILLFYAFMHNPDLR